MNNMNNLTILHSRYTKTTKYRRHNRNITSTAAFRIILPHCELMVIAVVKGSLLAVINGKGALENIDMNSYC